MLDLYDHEVAVAEPAGRRCRESFIEAGIS
jgi:hypothetical protein